MAPSNRSLILTAGLCAAMLGGHGAAPPAAAEDTVVRVWHTEVEPASIEAIANIITRFEAKKPGHQD